MNRHAEDISIFHVAETDSTNTEVKRIGQTNRGACAVWADYQVAGRGQRGTSWESERGKNLLFSIMFSPRGVEIRKQFRLSQAMALAICDSLNGLHDGFCIKWPNDIYYRGKKVSGTIIETTWKGAEVDRCILGVGINVNQTKFVSDAPNPVSVKQIIGREYDRLTLLHNIIRRFSEEINSLYNNGEASLTKRYTGRLMWKDRLHTYRDNKGCFVAETVDVEADGHLVLKAEGEDTLRRYMFKEVQHVLDKGK